MSDISYNVCILYLCHTASSAYVRYIVQCMYIIPMSYRLKCLCQIYRTMYVYYTYVIPPQVPMSDISYNVCILYLCHTASSAYVRYIVQCMYIIPMSYRLKCLCQIYRTMYVYYTYVIPPQVPMSDISYNVCILYLCHTASSAYVRYIVQCMYIIPMSYRLKCLCQIYRTMYVYYTYVIPPQVLMSDISYNVCILYLCHTASSAYVRYIVQCMYIIPMKFQMFSQLTSSGSEQ